MFLDFTPNWVVSGMMVEPPMVVVKVALLGEIVPKKLETIKRLTMFGVMIVFTKEAIKIHVKCYMKRSKNLSCTPFY